MRGNMYKTIGILTISAVVVLLWAGCAQGTREVREGRERVQELPGFKQI
jgi:hypothetical protein